MAEMQQSIEDRLNYAIELGRTAASKAFVLFKQLAEEGSAWAMHLLARAYAYGMGVTVDQGEAEKWYLRAYQVGSAHTKSITSFYLGYLYLWRKEYDKAIETLRSGVDLGYPPSGYLLAEYWRKGPGGNKQLSQARELHEWAAARGDIGSKYALVHLYLSGRFGIGQFFRGLFLYWRTIREYRSYQRLKNNFHKLDNCEEYEFILRHQAVQ